MERQRIRHFGFSCGKEMNEVQLHDETKYNEEILQLVKRLFDGHQNINFSLQLIKI